MSIRHPDGPATQPGIYIVARCDSMEHTQKLERAGANQVLFPHMYGGLRMAQSVLRPSVVNFMDLAMRGENADLQMEQLTVALDSEVRARTWWIRTSGNASMSSSSASSSRWPDALQSAAARGASAGDTLILVGDRQNLADMQKVLA